MGKRKAAGNGDELTKTTTASPKVSGEDAEVVAKMKEHREYLLAQTGLTPEDVDTPPPKKRKTAPKKTKKDDETDTPTNLDALSIPREVVAAVEPVKDDLSTTEAASPPKKKKSKAKAKLKSSKLIVTQQLGQSLAHESAVNSATSSYEDDICIKTQLEDLPVPQKRTKRTHSPVSKRTRPAPRSKKLVRVALNTQPSPAPLSNTLKAKIRGVHVFIEDGHITNPVFLPKKAEDNPNIIEISSRILAGVLKRLYIDYELGDPEMAHLAELELCIAGRFTADVKDCKGQNWMRVDFGLLREVELLEEIKRKVEGCGLDDVNLLEVEMMMMERQILAQHGLLEEVGKEHVSAPNELQAFFEKTWKETKDRETFATVMPQANDIAAEAAVLETPTDTTAGR